MSVNILRTNCDQRRSMVQCCFTSIETVRLIRTESPGRPPRLSHSSVTLQPVAAAVTLCSGVSAGHWPALLLLQVVDRGMSGRFQSMRGLGRLWVCGSFSCRVHWADGCDCCNNKHTRLEHRTLTSEVIQISAPDLRFDCVVYHIFLCSSWGTADAEVQTGR